MIAWIDYFSVLFVSDWVSVQISSVTKRKGFMSTINETIKQLEVQRARAEQEVAALTTAISALTALETGSAPKAAPAVAVVAAAKPAKKSTMSAAGRARIVAAQKARWAKIKAAKPAAKPVTAKSAPKPAAKVVAKPTKKKRKMSPEAIAKIVAAQKARWAKVRAAKAAPAS